MTTWRAVPGWAGLYEVSDEGQVRSVSRLAGTRIARGPWLGHPEHGFPGIGAGSHGVSLVRVAPLPDLTMYGVLA